MLCLAPWPGAAGPEAEETGNRLRVGWEHYWQTWMEGGEAHPPRILFPLFSVPVMLVGETDFICVVDLPSEPEEWNAYVTPAVIDDPRGTERYPLEIVAVNRSGGLSGHFELTLRAPSRLPAALYDLTIGADGAHWSNANAVAVRQDRGGDITFVHITDTHISRTNDMFRRVYAEAIREINTVNPDFVIITGDISDNGREAEFEIFVAETLLFRIPVFVVSGNHDHYGPPGEGIEAYGRIVNPYLDYTFDFGEYIRFYALDDGPQDWAVRCRGLTPDQVAWLENDLAAHASAYGKIMMMNHGPWYDSLIPNRDGLDAILWLAEVHGIDWVFTGHTHFDKVHDGLGWRQRGTARPVHEIRRPVFIQTTTVARERGFTDSNGYRVVRMRGGRVETYSEDLVGDGRRDADKSRRLGAVEVSDIVARGDTVHAVTIVSRVNDPHPRASVRFSLPAPPSGFGYAVSPEDSFQISSVFTHRDGAREILVEGRLKAQAETEVTIHAVPHPSPRLADGWEADMPSEFEHGVSLRLPLTLVNEGASATGPFIIQLRSNLFSVQSKAVDLPADSHRTVFFEYTPRFGETILEFILDAEGALPPGAVDTHGATHRMTVSGGDWHGFPVSATGWVDTGEWMGWLFLPHYPWVFSRDLESFVYFARSPRPDGAWIHVPFEE